jgi:hypothetical protein
LNERARKNERRLAKEKNSKAGEKVLAAEKLLASIPKHTADPDLALRRWALSRAVRPVILDFYRIQNQQGKQRYSSFNARRSALDREVIRFKQQFAIDAVPAVLAAGTWRPAGGRHFRRHRPGLSVKVRRRLTRIRGCAFVHVPEPYALPSSLSSSLLLPLFRWHRC